MTKKLILLFMLIMFNVIANAEYKPDIIVQMGHTSRVSSLCYSPDGRYIVSASDDGKAKLWDTITGKVLRTFTGHEMGIYSVCFSPDGKYIVTGSVDNTIKKWDVENGREIGSFLGHEKIVQAVCYSPSGKYVASGSYDKTVRLWDASQCSEVISFAGHEKEINTVCFSPDEMYLASGASDHTIKIWDVDNKALNISLSGHSDAVTSICYYPDGKYLASSITGNNICLWDLNNKEDISTFIGHTNDITSIQFSPNSNYLVSASADSTIKLWDVHTRRELKTFIGHKDHVNSVCFSPNGRFLISSSNDETIKLWDVNTGKEIKTILKNIKIPGKVILSQDARYIAFVSGMQIGVIDLKYGQLKHVFKGHTSIIPSLAFSSDGKYLVSGSWDIESGKEYRQFIGHNEAVTTVTFTPDNKRIISGSWDGSVRIWNIENNDCIAFTYVLSGNRWFVYTHDGYWDGSRNCGDLVAMVRGMECWNIDQFAVNNNMPDIVLQRLGSTDTNLINHYYRQYKKRLKRLGFTEDQLSSQLHVPVAKIIERKQDGKNISITFSLNDSKYKLKTYNIYANDVPLFGAYGKPITGKSKTITDKIELASGENKIEISCMNEKGAESYRALMFADYDKQVKGDLYFLGFGVSRYKNSELNLKYADTDVKDLAEIFEKMNTQYNKVHITTYLNEEVTPTNVQKAKDFLKGAKVDDTFVLFISGHGVHDTDEYNTYYYLTHNTDLDNLKQTAANFDLIEDLMQGITPRKKLFLMDTCESGEVEDDTQEGYYEMADAKGIRARTSRKGVLTKKIEKHAYLYEKDRYIDNDLLRRSGAIFFSSCKGGEFSSESDALANGLFNEEILNALAGGKADTDGNGVVTTDELRDYASTTVPEQCMSMQNPTVDRDNIYVKFGLPVIK